MSDQATPGECLTLGGHVGSPCSRCGHEGSVRHPARPPAVPKPKCCGGRWNGASIVHTDGCPRGTLNRKTEIETEKVEMMNLKTEIENDQSAIRIGVDHLVRMVEDKGGRYERAIAAGAELAAAVNAYQRGVIPASLLRAAYEKFMQAHAGNFGPPPA